MYASGSASTAFAIACRRVPAASFSSAVAPRDASASRREPLQRRNRLSRSRDFDAVYRHGRSVSTRFLTLYWFERDESVGDPRLGFAVPKAVGNAVIRNRIKRQLREIVRGRLEGVPPLNDYVLVVRPGLPEAADSNGYDWLEARVDEVLGKAAA
jgi:ribonuclease P protein component